VNEQRPSPSGYTILFVDHATALGGAEKILLLLLKNLDQVQWSLHLASPAGELSLQGATAGLPVHPVFLPRLRRSPRVSLDWLTGVLQVARLIRAIDPAVVCANTVRAALYAAPAARLSRKPFIWYMHDFWLSESQPANLWFDQLGKRALCATAKNIVAISHAVAAHLPLRKNARSVGMHEFQGILNGDYMVVPGVVDVVDHSRKSG